MSNESGVRLVVRMFEELICFMTFFYWSFPICEFSIQKHTRNVSPSCSPDSSIIECWCVSCPMSQQINLCLDHILQLFFGHCGGATSCSIKFAAKPLSAAASNTCWLYLDKNIMVTRMTSCFLESRSQITYITYKIHKKYMSLFRFEKSHKHQQTQKHKKMWDVQILYKNLSYIIY